MAFRSLFALLLLLACAAGARADEGGLDGTATGEPPAEVPPESSPAPVPEVAPEEPEAPLPPPALLPKPSLRFGLEDRARFHRWLAALCREEPVEPSIANRVRMAKDGTSTLSTANNKLGSLSLMLENYAELAQFRDACLSARKNSPAACTHVGRISANPKDAARLPWLALGSRAFQADVRLSRAPASSQPHADLLRSAEEQIKALDKALNKDFFEFRDVGELASAPDSASKSRALGDLVYCESICAPGSRSDSFKAHCRPAQK
jgi:hypothetical protein